MSSPSRYAIVLAAGQGTRFRSALPKVLHPVCGKPMLEHVLDTLKGLDLSGVLVVIGHQAETIRAAFADRQVEWVLQEKQLGTAHAVLMAERFLQGKKGSVLVLHGDAPLLREETLRRLIEAREKTTASLSLLTAHLDEPGGYGRILRGSDGKLRIVEDRDASPEERLIKEVNPGVYCFDLNGLFSSLRHISQENAQREFYLPDAIGVLNQMNRTIVTAETEAEEILGVNDRLQLSHVEEILQRRIVATWLDAGVTIRNPTTVFIGPDVTLAADVVVEQGCLVSGRSRLDRGAVIGPFSAIYDSEIGAGAFVEGHCLIRSSRVGPSAVIAAFSFLETGTVVSEGSRFTGGSA